MREIINILWQDNQTKKENKKTNDMLPLWQAFPGVPCAYLYDTLTRPPQSSRMKSTCEKKMTLSLDASISIL